MARPSKLQMHPKMMALAVLKHNKQPMSAYDILACLKPQGVRAATVVYRALDALIEEGVVHKIQALNAFVACNCDPDHVHSLSVLTICGDCKDVEELHDQHVIHQLEELRMQGVQLTDDAVIELPIICENCSV